MKNRNLILVFVLLCAVVLAACAPASEPAVVEPTQAPVAAATEEPTAAPADVVVEEPTAAPVEAEATSEPAAAPVDAPATLAPTKATPDVTGTTPTSAEEILRIAPEELKALIDGGADIVVVDNQPAEAYVIEHVKGAVNLPWDTDIKNPAVVSKNKLAILYCGCANEEDASDVALQLITKFKYKQVMLLDGGWDRWMELGYPTEKGE